MMIPLLPDFSSAIAPQALPQPGGSANGSGLGGGLGDLDFAGLLDAALPSAPAGTPDAAAPSAPAGPVPTTKASAASAPSLPLDSLPELQPLLQAQPQPPTKTQSKTQSPAEPLMVPLPPGGTDLPPSGTIVPGAAFTKSPVSDLPQPDEAPAQAALVKGVAWEKPLAEHGDRLPETPKVSAPQVKLGAGALEAILAPEAAASDATTKLPSPPPVPLAPTPLPTPVPPPPSLLPLPLTKGAPTTSVSRLATDTEVPVLDPTLPDPLLSDLLAPPTPTPTLTPTPTIASLPVSQAQAAPAVLVPPAPTAEPAPIQPAVVGVAPRAVAVAEPLEGHILPLPLAVPGEASIELAPSPQLTPEQQASAPVALLNSPTPTPTPTPTPLPLPLPSSPPPAPSTPVAAGLPGPVGKAVVAAPPNPPPGAPRAVAPAPIAPPSLAALAQRPDMQAKNVRSKVVTTSPAGGGEPAFNALAPAPAAPASEAAPPLPSLASSPVPTPASPPLTAMPAAPVIAPAPEPSAAPEPARSAPAPQLEQTITAVSDLREAMRAARPEMTLRHAEFGAVSLRLEAAGAQDWRVVLASRDPGFVPAIQAALAERAVAAAAETSLAGNGGQSGSGEPRYGSSLGSGQGGSQPYPGQSQARDEGGPAHHHQQRQQRGSGTPAAADAGSQPGDGTPRERGLFA